MAGEAAAGLAPAGGGFFERDHAVLRADQKPAGPGLTVKHGVAAG
jgi:hypothetical protein